MPLAEPVEEIELVMESVAGAEATCQFQMGKGGCCFASDRRLTEGDTIGLSIQFARDGQRLKAQGTVRWFDGGGSQAGVSFVYLDPSCRDWVAAACERACRTFIPQCRCDASAGPSVEAVLLTGRASTLK